MIRKRHFIILLLMVAATKVFAPPISEEHTPQQEVSGNNLNMDTNKKNSYKVNPNKLASNPYMNYMLY